MMVISKGKVIVSLFIAAFSCWVFTSHLFAADLDSVKEELEKQQDSGSDSGGSGIIQRPNVEYASEGLRDPFQGSIRKEDSSNKETPVEVTQAERPLPSLTIQGVVWGGDFPQAIINNKVVKAGDNIEGAQIIEINKDNIILFYANQQYKLPLLHSGQGSDKKPKGGENEKSF
jgi:type II secretory pathway component PulC